MAEAKATKSEELSPEIQAKVEAMVAAALAKEKGDAVKQQEARDAKRKAQLSAMEEKVTIKLFKDGKEYKDDVFVAVNGENRLIKRGVPVEIERKFAEVLKHSMKQDIVAAEFSESKQNEYRDESAKRGL